MYDYDDTGDRAAELCQEIKDRILSIPSGPSRSASRSIRPRRSIEPFAQRTQLREQI